MAEGPEEKFGPISEAGKGGSKGGGSAPPPPRGTEMLKVALALANPHGPAWPPPNPPPPPRVTFRRVVAPLRGPWTVTRSSLRMLRRVAAFCRPLRPVLCWCQDRDPKTVWPMPLPRDHPRNAPQTCGVLSADHPVQKARVRPQRGVHGLQLRPVLHVGVQGEAHGVRDLGGAGTQLLVQGPVLRLLDLRRGRSGARAVVPKRKQTPPSLKSASHMSKLFSRVSCLRICTYTRVYAHTYSLWTLWIVCRQSDISGLRTYVILQSAPSLRRMWSKHRHLT